MDSKLNKKDRMNRAKDSKDKKSEKPVDKTKQKKRGGGFAPPEDDDVDSRGNIRNLIAYSDESGLITDDESPRQKKHQSRKSDKKPRKISVSDEEDDDIQPRRRGFHPRKAAVKAGDKIKRKLRKAESETESEDDDYDSEEEESEQPTTLESEEADEDDEEEEYDEEEEDEDSPPRNRILLNFGFGDSSSVDERMIPKRYKIKKESESVQKFFKLMTEPIETETIDDHIDQFKALKEDEQKRLRD